LLNFSQQAPASSPQIEGGQQQQVNRPAALTPQQAEEARRIARAEKAKRLNLSPSEVNLTSQEAKAAKAAFREKLAKGEISPSQTPPTKPSNPPSKNNSSKNGTKGSTTGNILPPAPQNQKEEKKKVGVQLDKTGSRATAKTKLDNLRRTTLRSLPSAIDDCRVLHLIAYGNHFNRLARQWEEYQKTYESSGMLNPLRGLPAPSDLPSPLQQLMMDGKKGLREQNDSPGTYVLQSELGASFWNQDRPSEACPDSLRRALSEEEKGAFERAAVAAQKV